MYSNIIINILHHTSFTLPFSCRERIRAARLQIMVMVGDMYVRMYVWRSPVNWVIYVPLVTVRDVNSELHGASSRVGGRGERNEEEEEKEREGEVDPSFHLPPPSDTTTTGLETPTSSNFVLPPRPLSSPSLPVQRIGYRVTAIIPAP